MRASQPDSATEVRPLGPLDLARLVTAGPNGMTDQAVTITNLCQPRSFRTSILGLSRRSAMVRSSDAWVCVGKSGIHGLATIRQRSGPRSWELSRLYSNSRSGQVIVRLLESAAAGAGLHGAERVFLRVPADSPTVSAARLAGFFPSHLDTVYQGTARLAGPSHSLFDAESHMRQKRRDDDHSLFRLYNAATPVKVRQLVGMTFDQWASSQEPGPGRSRESVLVVADDVQGWLCTSSRPGRGALTVRLHPDYDTLTPEVVEAGLKRLSGTRSVFAVVEEHAPRLATALEGMGFQARGEFVVLVKSIAQRVLERVPGRSSQAIVE